MMRGWDRDLHIRVRQTLLRYPALKSNEQLYDLCVDARIYRWQNNLPERTSDQDRAQAMINYFVQQENEVGENGLLLFLAMLRDTIPKHDALYGTTTQLMIEVQEALPLPPPFSERYVPDMRFVFSIIGLIILLIVMFGVSNKTDTKEIADDISMIAEVLLTSTVALASTEAVQLQPTTISTANSNTLDIETDMISLSSMIPTATISIAKESTNPLLEPPLGTEFGRHWTRPKDEMIMVYVPAGTFMMGSDYGDLDEKPIREVTLSDYWIDQTEVSNSQYVKFLNRNGNLSEGGGMWLDISDNDVKIEQIDEHFVSVDGYENHPVVEVSWFGAQAYCLDVGGRLPTEAQWEYAARGTQNQIYPWGNVFDPNLANCADCNDGDDRTSPVGSFPRGASWVEALDMAGSVWEWTNDWYGDYPDVSVKDPQGQSYGTLRVLRGGGGLTLSVNMRSANRNYLEPTKTGYFIGFRCVMLTR